MSKPTKAELSEEIHRLEIETTRRKAFDDGNFWGRIHEIGRVYETRIDCNAVPERVRRTGGIQTTNVPSFVH